MKKIMFLFMFGAVLLTSCMSEEPISCIIPSVKIMGKSKVIVGETINLTTSLIGDATYSYSWSGPNGFTSSLSNPLISNATSAMSGEYKLTVKKGVCESIESSIAIEVMPNPVNCNITNNTMRYSGGSLNTSTFNSIFSTISSDQYTLKASGNDDLQIIFYNEKAPAVGLYTIKQRTAFLTSKEVSLTLVKSGYFFSASTGTISVTSVDNKLTFTFCDVLFNSAQQFPFEVKGSARITKP